MRPGPRPSRQYFRESRLWCLLTAGMMAVLPLFTPAANASAPIELESRLVELYQRHADAVVRVKVALVEEQEGEDPQISLLVFSGFFISREGLVLTNSIPTDQLVGRIFIEKNGIQYLAEAIGSDPATNVALLQVLLLPRELSWIEVPSSHQKPRIGQPVLTITSPLDFAPTPAFGLVSGFESYFADFVFPFTYTRIGIPMGPAEGGSPVIDLEGNLVGITVASVPEVRSSYVVPSRALEKMVADFSTRGAIRYGTLPLELTERPDQDRLARVVVVDGVASGSAAASAGIRVGDKVRTMGGKQIRTIDDVRDAIFYARVGQFLLLEVDRGGNRLEFALMVEEDTSKPDPAPLPTPPGTEPTLPPQTEESEPLPTIP